MTIAEATWVATALLHKENPAAKDFSVAEIKERVKKEGLVDGSRSGLSIHVSQHCVANKKADPATHRILFRTVRGRRRLFRALTDECHPDRQKGKIRPEKSDLSAPYQELVDWYDTVYSGQPEKVSRSSFELSDGRKQRVPVASSVAGLVRLLSKPLFLSSAGDLVIPKELLRELDVTADVPLSVRREQDYLIVQPITESYIAGLVGSFRGETDLVEARERDHRIER